jgi:CubicO group peptidase (beta-lactamase class C family)
VHLAFAALLALARPQAARIDAIVAAVMHDHRIAGLSLGIARRGRVLELRGFGEADPPARRAADGFTIYPIGSLTKQFTAVLVLQQVAAGELALDTGAPAIARLLDQTVGDRWQYSNANYAALGALLERSARVPFCDLLARRVTRPLHLLSTSCAVSPYAWNVARPWPPAAPEPIAPAAGGMLSNAHDLLRWLEALRSGKVIPMRLFDAMATSGRIHGIPTHYGFGFFVVDWYGYRTIEHSGYVDGFSAEDAIVRGAGLEIALLANRAHTDLVPLAKSIVAILAPPRDRNLVARLNAPPENEDRTITRLLPGALEGRFPQLGAPALVEFIERSRADGEIADVYRVTYPGRQFRIVVRYRAGGAIDSLTLLPDWE